MNSFFGLIAAGFMGIHGPVQTIVIGHKNPDMDSICSALGYARLKQLLGVPDVTAARAGNTNERIDYVLERFGVAPPVFMSDVSPRVGDVMARDLVSVRANATVYDAIQLMAERQLRGLPVTDADNRCLGLLSAFELNHYLFPRREETTNPRAIVSSLRAVVETFGGSATDELSDDAGELVLMVGAMSVATFALRLETLATRRMVVFVGDREDIQLCAIEAKVRAVVVTGGLPVTDQVRAAAAAAHVVVASSPHDTVKTVLLARGAVHVERMMETYTSFSPDTPLELARDRVAPSDAFIFPIIGEDGRLVGALSKSDFLKPVPRQLILVDHNELSQAVSGADQVPIVEILDHHRLGGFSTELPIHFWNNPVGSTSTIVAMCYQQMDVAIPPDIAGLLAAGLISDTLNLTSPTATAVDRTVLDHLAKIAGINPARLAEEIFSVGSPLLTLTPGQVILADCKEYAENGRRFSVAQIEELNFSHFAERQAGLLEALEKHCRGHGLYFAALLVTDINTQNSLLLVAGAAAFIQRIRFPMCGPHVWELEGIVSRKKQLLPYLLEQLAGLKGI
jgi:manganese-dependent inorganic pyrophosphatase